MKKTISAMMALAMAGAMSMPALAANTAPQENSAIPAGQTAESVARLRVTVNGKTIGADAVQENGCVMVPLRAICEELGFTVSWNPDRTIKLKNQTMQTDLAVGVNSYIVYTAIPDADGMSAPFTLGSAPVLKNDRTYVPVQLFVPLVGNDPSVVTIQNGEVTIRTETDDNAQTPNPLTEHESLAALTGAVGFDVTAPSVPEGYTAELYLDIGGKVAEINYRNGEKELCYRVSRGSGDISGVYTTYSTEKTLDVKGVSVKAQGNTSTELATWSTGDFTWSVYAPDGLTDAQVQQIAASVLK